MKLNKIYSPVRFYFINIILFLVIIIVGFVLLSPKIFKVNTVEVKGNSIYTDEEVQELVLNEKYKNNGLYDVVANFFSPPKNVPFINEVKVSLKNRNSLLISVKEKELAGYLKQDKQLVYFDDSAVVQEISEMVVDDDSLIELSGLKTDNPVVGKELPAASGRARAVSVIYKNIASRKIPVSIVKFDESDGSIMLRSDKIDVMLGTKSNLEEKLRRLSYILPKLEKKKGVLHLEDFSEENTDIVFEEK